jgi:4-hydroxybenzoate polyprenyltransferase
LDWTATFLGAIDTRSFSSLWFWIVIAVTWSMASYWVLGIPYDVILRGREEEGVPDLEDLVRINVTRMLVTARDSGAVMLGIAVFLLTALLVLAVWYRVELAQAFLFLLVPLMVLAWRSLLLAQRIYRDEPRGAELARLLLRHRLLTQGIGMAAIFLAALFGAWRMLAALPF